MPKKMKLMIGGGVVAILAALVLYLNLSSGGEAIDPKLAQESIDASKRAVEEAPAPPEPPPVTTRNAFERK